MRPPIPRSVALLALVPALASGVLAQPAGPALSALLGARLTLPNGVVLLVAERPGLPIVTVRAGVAAGAILDPPERAGLANLTALLLTRGTRGRTAVELDRAIEFVGGSLEGEGGRDGAELTLVVLRKDLGLGLDLLADALLRPTFPASEFERQREEVRASVRRGEEDPSGVAGRALRRMIFSRHPYGQPVDGTEASLAALTREDVVAFYGSAYRPEATVVAVAGDVTVAEVRAELAGRLGGWVVTRPAPAAAWPAPETAPARVDAIERPLTQATALLGRAAVTRHHPDHYPLVVASQLLGGGSSSRLYTRIREERGLAYSVYAQHASGRFGGLFLVEVQSENARVREVLTLVREELQRLRRERVSGEELARAKGYLVGSFPLRMDTAGEVSRLLLQVEQLGLGLDYPGRYRQAISAVTADEVLRVARAYWDPDAMSLALVGNLREAGIGSP